MTLIFRIQRNTDYRIVMDRDRRLTGYLRGQTDNAVAPAGFELNNPWRVRIPYDRDYIRDFVLTLSISLRGASSRVCCLLLLYIDRFKATEMTNYESKHAICLISIQCDCFSSL